MCHISKGQQYHFFQVQPCIQGKLFFLMVNNITPSSPLQPYASSASLKQWAFFVLSVLSKSLFIHLARFSRLFEHLGRCGSPGSSQSETLVASTSSYDYSAEPRPRALDVATCNSYDFKNNGGNITHNKLLHPTRLHFTSFRFSDFIKFIFY